MNGIMEQKPLGALALAEIISLHNAELHTSLQKIAHGLRVSTPISEISLQGQRFACLADVSGTRAANVSDHIHRLKFTQDALRVIEDTLRDMAEKTLAASNEFDDRARSLMGREFDLMLNSIEAVVDSTSFDGQKLLNGSLDALAVVNGKPGTSLKVQAGEDLDDIFTYQILDMRMELDGGSASNTFHGLNISKKSAEHAWGCKDGMNTALAAFHEITGSDSGLVRVHQNMVAIEKVHMLLQQKKATLFLAQSNLNAVVSLLEGFEQDTESAQFTSLQIQQQAAASHFAQSAISYGNTLQDVLEKAR